MKKQRRRLERLMLRLINWKKLELRMIGSLLSKNKTKKEKLLSYAAKKKVFLSNNEDNNISS
jgi:hypothetical protein